MKLPGIGTLILFGMFWNCGKAVFADINPFTIDDYRASDETDAGEIEINDSGPLAVRFEEATATTIHDPTAANEPFPDWINAGGPVFEFLQDAAGLDGSVDTDGTFVTLTDPSAGGGTVVIGINSNGQIVGTFHNRTMAHHFRAKSNLADVPEPSTLPLLAVCWVAILMVSRYRLGAQNS